MSYEKGLDGSDTFLCWWPETSKGVRRMAKEEARVNKSTWNMHYDVRIMALSNNWDRILEKEKKAQDTSCLDTEEEDGKNTRQSRIPSRYINTSGEDDPADVPEARADDVRNTRLPLVPLFATTPNRLPSRPVVNGVSPQSRSSTSPSGRSTSNTVSSASNRGFEVTVIKLLTELTLECKELRKRVDHNTSLLNEIGSRRMDAFTLREDPLDTDLGVDLPLHSVNEVKELEVKLADDEFANKLVMQLAVLGGKDVQATVKSIMANLLAPEVACYFNWTGVKGKEGFQQLKLGKVLLRAVRQNSKTRDATKDEVKAAVVAHLYNARDMKGGRKRRANGQRVIESGHDSDENEAEGC